MKSTINAITIPLILCLLLSTCSVSTTTPTSGPVTEDQSADESQLTEPVLDTTKTPETAVTPEPTPTQEAPAKQIQSKAIVWLGDSLTQGSLGDNNDNLENAPYEKLQKMVNIPVEGYGMYGFNTHDAIWTYTDEEHYNQIADPEKIYIFWLGSNDWVTDDGINSNTEPVIKEIDRFLNLEDGGIQNYIVLGTTSRWRLEDLYIPINKDLADHYGEHYMDVIDIINKYGYSPDNTHLSQESYNAIAVAVYEKLKELGYLSPSDCLKSGQTIVWLGDSLTQGSLGDDNDNLENAPYKKLESMVNVPVEGYGMYAFNSHDIIWTYTDEEHYHQIADPDKTFIFWMGSNDWVTSEGKNTNTEPVIKEIDRFLNLEEGGIKNYIVIGTASKKRLGDLYIPINKDLEEHYKEHYMDVIDIVDKYGHAPGNTHLSQAAYDAVAERVYEKLKSLGYI
ncbi:MAG: SGNH/GDSL hydrolase family protein [Lachnospiraceae bacterium]|nr:SGNH/GDSL hydrolase family protein [Lachnospiraceae bacterium]